MVRFGRLLSLACALALCNVMSAQAQTQEEILNNYKNAVTAGDEYMNKKEFTSAIQSYDEAIKIVPALPQGYIGRGNAYRELKQYERALADYQSAMDKNFDGPSPLALYGRGKLYLDLQQYQLAAPDLQAAFQAQPDNKDVKFALAKVYAMGGVGTEAEKMLSEIIAEDDQNAEAYALRGRAYASLQQHDLALADLNRAIELDPTSSEARFTLGIVLWQQKDYAKAADAMSKAIELYKAPDESDLPYIQAYLTKASVHEDAAKGTQDEALASEQLQLCVDTCNELLGKLPETDAMEVTRGGALLQRGVAERLAGKFADAVRSFTEGINLNPEVAEMYFRRGICWHQMNETKLAVLDFESAQTIDYANPRFYLWEGLAHAKDGEYYLAVESYGAAIALSNRYVDAFMNRGHAYSKLSEFDKAIADFNECIRLEPTTGMHYFRRGVAQALAEQHDAATQSFVNAIQFDPHLIDSYEWLADELTHAGKADLAAEYRAKAKELKGE